MPALIVQFQNKHHSEVREIFFESSTKKDFKDDSDKEAFFEKYVGFYLRHYPELCFVAESNRVLGYVVASSHSTREDLLKLQPHLEMFRDYLELYPGHLHINCHYESRGLGIGGKLISVVEQTFNRLNISGWHIMTGPTSMNRNFYRKLGLDFEVEINFHGSGILLMGKSLSDDKL